MVAKGEANKTRGAPEGKASREIDKNKVIEETELYERREETRDEFTRTAYEEDCTVGKRGQIAYAYKVARNPSVNGQEVSKEIEKLGIQTVIYDVLKSNYQGVTTSYKGGAVTVEEVGVFINNKIERNPVETIMENVLGAPNGAPILI